MSVRDFELVTLRNGSRAVRHLGNGEVMHPSVGPWGEANQLYVQQSGLAELLCAPIERPLCILDVGLGAAANAVAALHCARELGARRTRPLEVISLEHSLEPLRLALADLDGFPFLASWQQAAGQVLTEHHWEEQGLSWRLHLGDILEQLPRLQRRADLVFFDPFSPSSNPTLWTRAALAQVRGACNPEGCLLLTYSAATPTRVSLLLAGFFVGQGAAIGTKAETTVAAVRKDQLAQPLHSSWLGRWTRSSARAPHGEALTPELEAELLRHPQWAQ